jgi:hypothetical protein
MTFTYTGDLATDLDQIRFHIDDVIEDTGIKPNGTNFSDEEIEGLLAVEGSVGRTVAAIFQKLAGAYARSVDTKIGPRDEKSSQTAKMYADLAKQWRENYGYPSGVSGVTTGTINLGIDEEDSTFNIT